jgi:hypothetical protein
MEDKMPKTPPNSHKPGKEPMHTSKNCPPFEEIAAFYIENEADQKRALGFAEWLRENKMSPLSGTNGYNWYISFKFVDYNNSKNGKIETYHGTYHGCYIKMFNDTWHILPAADILEQILTRETLKEVLWDSIYPCYGCNYGCFKKAHNSEYKKEIFGREFTGKGICLWYHICLSNPADNTLETLKTILLERKAAGEKEKIGFNKYR